MKTGKSKDHLQRVFLRFLYLIMGSILSLDSVMAQENLKISGQVTDNKGEAIIGASVKVLKTGTGTISDMDGKFTIQVPVGAELEIGYVGYNPKRVKVVNKNFVTVVLEENVVALGDVVVVGYGIQKKESLTGAIGNLKVDDIVKTKAPSLAQAIQGKVAGLRIRQENGEPGKFSSNINVRGFGTPLFVIDGVVRDGSSEFQRLNPEDIESISFLKDATASIYGMNSANGAVIVTTKKGATGKPRITLNANVGITSPTNVPEMANARQYMTMRNEAEINAGRPAYITKDELTKWQQGAPGYESVDLYDAVFNKHATQFQTTLSLEGGTDKVSYYGSFGYATDNSLLKNNALTYDKYTFRSNVSLKITKDLTASINLGGRYDTTNRPWFPFYDIFKSTRVNPPTTSIYANDNPDYYNNFSYVPNPAAMIDADYTGSAKERNKNLQTQFALEYNIPYVKGLKVKGTFIYDYNNYGYKATRKGFKTYTYGEYTGEYTAADANYPALLQDNRRESERVDMQFQTNYNRTFGNHTIGATYVFERREEKANWMNGERKFDFFTIGELDNARESDQKVSGSSEHQAYLSHIGRLTYDYKGKYLFETNGRYDGSSKFPKKNRFGFFPSVSVGWNIARENFMKPVAGDWLSDLKLRGTWGQIGNQGIDPYKFVPTMSQVEKKDVAWLVNGAKPLTLNAPGLVSDSFTWETVETLDFGFDITALNGRLQSTFDWYRRDTKDMLAPGAELPSVVGASAPLQNTADLRTKGWELSLTWRDRIGAWGYNVGFNLYDSKTVVTKYHNESKIILKSDGTNNYYEGYEIGSIWGYVTDGYYTADDFEDTNTWKLKEGVVTVDGVSPRPGDIKYQNLRDDGSSTNRIDTGDGTFDNPGDRKIIGNNSLRLQYGINLGVNYKGFDLSVLLQGVGKRDVWISDARRWPFNSGQFGSLFKDQLDYWKPVDSANGDWTAANPNAEYFRIYGQGNNSSYNTRAQTKYLMNGSYLRVKNVTLSYNFPKSWLAPITLTSLKAFVSCENLHTFTKLMKGYDPERLSWGYPFYRTISFGFNVTL